MPGNKKPSYASCTYPQPDRPDILQSNSFIHLLMPDFVDDHMQNEFFALFFGPAYTPSHIQSLATSVSHDVNGSVLHESLWYWAWYRSSK